MFSMHPETTYNGIIRMYFVYLKLFLTQCGFFGSVSDLLVFISGLARFNEVKPLNVRLRILGVIKMHSCKFISTLK